jgi:uncharacterized membrane protein
LGRLSDAKILGGIGSILQIIPFASIVGFILTLIAVKFISDELKDGSIFNDTLYAVITAIIGVAVGAGTIFLAIITAPLTFGVSALAGIFVFLVIVWIAFVVSAIFLRRAFNAIAQKLNAPSFRTAGTLYFYGAILTIVLVGFIILFIAYIFQIVAFFSINDSAMPAQLMQTASAVPAASLGMKYCKNCGTQMAADAMFCPKCGTQQ